jgi:hypothetical protein
MASSSSNVVGVHYRVGKKIGEGSFGVIFEGTNLLNNQQVAIKFVRRPWMPGLAAPPPACVPCPPSLNAWMAREEPPTLTVDATGTAEERCSSAP